MNTQLIGKAKELLEAKEVRMVIGWEEGTAGTARPAFILHPSMADRLIYDSRCIHNLALYLSKHEVKHAGKVAIVAPYLIMKSIIILAQENQVADKDLKVLGIGKDGELIDFAGFEDVEKYVNENPQDYREKDKKLLEKIDSMNMQERWDYWQAELSKCIKCYACRGACPMCYCGKCTVDCNQPQWISVPSHELGNIEWHIMRAMHLAGRCSNCGQCADSCPLDLPVNILTLKISEDVLKNFGYRAGTSLKQEYVLSTFHPNDKDNFIN